MFGGEADQREGLECEAVEAKGFETLFHKCNKMLVLVVLGVEPQTVLSSCLILLFTEIITS